MIRAEIHRNDFGSAAYLWLDGRERVYSTTSEAHAAMRRRGTVVFLERRRSGQTSVETYVIERATGDDAA